MKIVILGMAIMLLAPAIVSANCWSIKNYRERVLCYDQYYKGKETKEAQAYRAEQQRQALPKGPKFSDGDMAEYAKTGTCWKFKTKAQAVRCYDRFYKGKTTAFAKAYWAQRERDKKSPRAASRKVAAKPVAKSDVEKPIIDTPVVTETASRAELTIRLTPDEKPKKKKGVAKETAAHLNGAHLAVLARKEKDVADVSRLLDFEAHVTRSFRKHALREMERERKDKGKRASEKTLIGRAEVSAKMERAIMKLPTYLAKERAATKAIIAKFVKGLTARVKAMKSGPSLSASNLFEGALAISESEFGKLMDKVNLNNKERFQLYVLYQSLDQLAPQDSPLYRDWASRKQNIEDKLYLSRTYASVSRLPAQKPVRPAGASATPTKASRDHRKGGYFTDADKLQVPAGTHPVLRI